MVILFPKTLEKKKSVNDVTFKSIEIWPSELHAMSRGTALLSCGTADPDRWLDSGKSCVPLQRASCPNDSSLESLWDAVHEAGSQRWSAEPSSTTTAITSLIRDLDLSTSAGAVQYATSCAPAAPPSKRQCRSLSLSDDFAGFRSCWRPQGSRVWTAVEKRRCYSGGSVNRAGGHFPAMQRSSSFSLPSRTSNPPDGALDLPFFNQQLPLHPQFTASPVSPASPSSHRHQHSSNHVFLRPLSSSHEQISLTELHDEEASEASSRDSTPELGRRAGKGAGAKGCLSRSRSQPCVLNDRKIGMKRRRPEDAKEQRPSLDLAKMTQKLQTFQSLSCPGFTSADSCRSTLPPPTYISTDQSESDFRAVLEREPKPCHDPMRDDEDEDEDSSYEELDSDSACSVDSRPGTPARPADGKHSLWKGDCRIQRDIFQLGGELDLEQIERN